MSLVVLIEDSIVSLFCVDSARVVVGMRAASQWAGKGIANKRNSPMVSAFYHNGKLTIPFIYGWTERERWTEVCLSAMLMGPAEK